MSRIVKKRGVAAWMGAGASLRAGSTCEGGNVQNACLSFTLRAVRAYVWVWGALGAREINVTHYGGGFAFIWEKEKGTDGESARRAQLSAAMPFSILYL